MLEEYCPVFFNGWESAFQCISYRFCTDDIISAKKQTVARDIHEYN